MAARHKKRKRRRTTAVLCNHEDDQETNAVELCAKNHILFYCDVTPRTICKLRKILLLLENNKRITAATIHINSDGGCAYSGFAGHDIIAESSLDITTIVEGTCASAATLMSLAGDSRYIMPNATYMIHQVSTQFAGTFDELRVDFENSSSIMDRSVKIYQKTTKLKKSQILKELRSDREMNAKEAVGKGFADSVWSQ
jgi:ATP-dependent Clp protease protease subunit